MSPLIQEVLRGEMGFEGYVVTDSGAVEFMVSKFKRFTNLTDASAASLNAGADLNSGGSFSKGLPAALATGAVNETRLKQALARLFKARIELGLFDGNDGPFDKLGAADIASPANVATALAVAEESIVLLKNEKATPGAKKPLLPLDLNSKPTVAIIGPAANDSYRMLGNYYGCSVGTWGPVLSGCNVSTPLNAIQRDVEHAGGSVQYALGCDQETNRTTGFAEALSAAKSSDVVVVVLGLRNCEGGQGHGGHNCESEGHDRDVLSLPGVQGELLKELVQKSRKPVVMVLLNGGPVSTPYAAENVPALVEAWYGGSEGGNALSNVLFGRTSPAGRLPFSIVKSVTDLPDDLDMDPTAKPHGRTYRYFNETPLYNFGYGLSYTTHTYSKFEMPTVVHASKDKNVTACCTVTNAGSFLSQEVVQLYATRQPDPPAHAPSRLSHVPRVQLVSFTRTAAISPGDSLRVCLPVDIDSLRLWSGTNFAVQPGTYSFFIGPSAPGPRGIFVDEATISKPLVQTVEFASD
jgi:beta-glucosidase